MTPQTVRQGWQTRSSPTGEAHEHLSPEILEGTPAFSSSVRPGCEPGRPCARHATADCPR